MQFTSVRGDSYRRAGVGSADEWRLSRRWICLLVIGACEAAWLAIGGWQFRLISTAAAAGAFALFVLPLGLERYRTEPRIAGTLRACAYLIPFTAMTGVLSYLVVSTNAGLVDQRLADWDRVLGFDWLATYQWIVARPLLHLVLQLAYTSGLPQLALVVVFLGFTDRMERLNEFVWLFVMSTLVCIAISWPFPAAGPWTHYHLSSVVDTSAMSHFAALRDGNLRTIDLGNMQGLISIPSLHTALAVILAYAVRSTRLLGPFLVLDTLMILSTPITGGHYLVDVVAGAALAALLIFAKRLRK